MPGCGTNYVGKTECTVKGAEHKSGHSPSV